MNFSTMSDAEIGAMVRDRFERLADAHRMGLTDTHPREAWNADNKVLRTHAVIRDSTAGNSKETEAMDDPSHTPGTPSSPQRQGANIEAMDSIIPGYNRLGTARAYEPVLDKDNVVQSLPRGW